MLKRDITYEDFNGETITETFYFNLSKPELVEMEVEVEGGFGKTLQSIIEAKDYKALVKEFKNIILLAYGVKSDDGKRFIKSDQLREEFTQTNAYNELFMQLASDDKAAATFLTAVLPKDMAGEMEKALPKSSPTPPAPPSPPTT